MTPNNSVSIKEMSLILFAGIGVAVAMGVVLVGLVEFMGL